MPGPCGTGRLPVRDRDCGVDAEMLAEANGRAARALVSAGIAIGLAACGLSILSALVIDALVDRGLAPCLAKLLVAAALGIPALILARRAAAELQRGSVLPLAALRDILAEAGQPTRTGADDPSAP